MSGFFTSQVKYVDLDYKNLQNLEMYPEYPKNVAYKHGGPQYGKLTMHVY